jgi:hypothetical protein
MYVLCDGLRYHRGHRITFIANGVVFVSRRQVLLERSEAPFLANTNFKPEAD